jgi:hypothetical protein
MIGRCLAPFSMHFNSDMLTIDNYFCTIKVTLKFLKIIPLLECAPGILSSLEQYNFKYAKCLTVGHVKNIRGEYLICKYVTHSKPPVRMRWSVAADVANNIQVDGDKKKPQNFTNNWMKTLLIDSKLYFILGK